MEDLPLFARFLASHAFGLLAIVVTLFFIFLAFVFLGRRGKENDVPAWCARSIIRKPPLKILQKLTGEDPRTGWRGQSVWQRSGRCPQE
jgi:hypothetical protein